MGKGILSALVLLAMVVGAASPASAQSGGEVALPEGSEAPRDEDSLYRGACEVTEDGALIFGGDVVYRCEDLVRFGAPAKPGAGDVTVDGAVVEPLTRKAVGLCSEAGFPPDGATLDVPDSSSAPTTKSASATDTGGDGTLPETGSLAPSGMLPAAACAAGALLALRVWR